MKIVSYKLILFFLLISFQGICQKDVFIVKLQPTEKVEPGRFFISKVIDNRAVKDNIGIIQRGMANKKLTANFELPFEEELQQTFNVLLPPGAGKDSLVASITMLNISEKTGSMSETGASNVEIEFLRLIDNQLYSIGNYTATVEGKGLDVTRKHGERIIEALTQIIKKVSPDLEKEPSTLVIKDLQLEKHKIDFSAPVSKGLYYNFGSVSSNKPADSMDYTVKMIAETKKINHYQVYHGQSKKRIKHLYGFSDGTDFYLSSSEYVQEGYFVKSKLMGRFIYFEDQFSNPTASAAFGAIGALASNKYSGIVLDRTTGMVTVLNQKNTVNLLASYPVLLERYKSGKKEVEDVRDIILELNKSEMIE
ncbi:MAG: hypothetical protein WCD31_09680 [Gillisia sp.]